MDFGKSSHEIYCAMVVMNLTRCPVFQFKISYTRMKNGSIQVIVFGHVVDNAIWYARLASNSHWTTESLHLLVFFVTSHHHHCKLCTLHAQFFLLSHFDYPIQLIWRHCLWNAKSFMHLIDCSRYYEESFAMLQQSKTDSPLSIII